ncbi:amidase family protein [Micromonospora sp. NPDC007271]|uniref:amidase n=1 Tax=Micromonospora sp. NPDC007271 TaxID=3154587 RepID=UPI0033E531F3
MTKEGRAVSDAEELCWKPAVELSAMVRAKGLSPSEIAEAFIDRIDKVNPDLNAFVHHDPEQIRSDAKQLTDAAARGEYLGPLHGVPYAIKLLTSMKGLPYNSGMPPFRDRVGEVDATVVTRMRQAGGLFLGKTNASEGGYYGGTDNHLYGPTHNAWRQGLSPGGSSGGSAAAVASGLAPIAEGADGAGSVRIPSAFNGVVGFKPSLGLAPQTLLPSRYATWCFHGSIARTVADAALMLDVIAGEDTSDPLSLPDRPGRFVDVLDQPIEGLRVGWSPDLGYADVDPEIVAVCERAVRAFADLGATVEEADPGWANPEQAMWESVWVPGFACEVDMADWESLHGQVDDGFIELMRQARELPVAQFGRADAARGLMWDQFAAFMRRFDVLVSPTLARPPFPVGQFCPDDLRGESLRHRVLGWLLTYPYNMLATPAITVPAGFTESGLPVGLQIGGGLHADALVLNVAAQFERARPWHDKRPARNETARS